MKNSILASAQLLQKFAVGDTPVERFKNLIKPEALFQGTSMLGDDGEKFQACLAALIISYEKGTTEYDQVAEEVTHIAALGQALMKKDFKAFQALGGRKSPPLGLTGLWHGKTIAGR